MRRGFVLFASAIVVLAACSELFDEAQQCTVDRDCEKYDGVCDVAHGVCVAKGALVDGGGDGIAPPPPPPPNDATDAPVDPKCDVPNKPTEIVGGSATAGGADGGPATQIVGAVTLDCTKDWILKGRVFVGSGATLTIKAGTTIFGEKASLGELVVLPGGRLVAVGTRDRPIVFTSDQPTPQRNDWGGLYVLGNAPPANGNTFNGDPAMPYGGSSPDDASGDIEFVRVEYSVWGLVMAGVGRGTRVDSVEVRRNGDNCFTFFGGTFDAKHLVCQSPGDEFYELNDGYTGRLQFLFGTNMPPGSNEQNGVLATGGQSGPTLYNVTVCGSSTTDANYGLVVRDGSRLDMGNAIMTGWLAGVDFRGTIAAPTPELRGSISALNGTNPAYVEDAEVTDQNSPFFNDDNGFDEVGWYRDGARLNSESDPKLLACGDPKNPKPYPAAAITTNARTPPADGFFDTGAAFIGAFRDGADSWMTGAWVRFDDK